MTTETKPSIVKINHSASAARIFNDGTTGFGRIPGFVRIALAPEGGAGSGASGEGEGEGNKEPTGMAASLEAAAKAKEESENKAKEEADKNKDKPSDKEAELLKDVMKHKNAAKDAQKELSTLKDQLKAFDGIDPAAVRELLNEKQTKETKDLEAKGEFERVKGIMTEAHKNEVKELNEKIATLQGQITAQTRELDEITIGNEFSTSKFIGDELTIGTSHARKLYGAHFERKDGKVVAYDKPAGAADRTPLVGSDGEALAFEDAMRALIEQDSERDRLKRAKVKQGAGGGSDLKQTAKQDSGKPELRGMSAMSAALAAQAKK